MANIDKLLENLETLNVNDESFIKICQNIAQDISKKELLVVELVTKLGYLLVNTVPDKRAHGTFILSSILSNIDVNFFNTGELQFITSFYADRSKDHHNVIPAVLKGILAISHMKNIDEKSIQVLLMSLFDNISCPQQKLSDRLLYYEILKEFSINYQTAIINMNQQYIVGLIQSMDGERDPGCLLFLFTWIPDLLKFLPIHENIIEDLFDVMSCYFPVDFRTPPELTGRKIVTREELAYNLNRCLCALPEFDQFCLPLILEKVDSALKVAKSDSMDLLASSCEIFNPLIFESHSDNIWRNLEKEVLKGSEVKENALNTVTALVKNMSKSENKEILPKICQRIYDTSFGNLRPDAELFSNTCDLLLAISKGSKETCKKISSIVIPLFLNQYNLQKDPKYQYEIFLKLLEFVKTYVHIYEVTNLNENEILLEVPMLCIQTLQHSEPTIKQIGLRNIPKIFKIWPQNMREAFYLIFKKFISTSEPEFVRNEMNACLKSISEQFPEEITEQILDNNEKLQATELKFYLDAIKVLVTEEKFMEIILKKIVSECQAENKINSSIGFLTLHNLLKNNFERSELFLTLHQDFKIVDIVFNIQYSETVFEILKVKSEICSMVIQKLDIPEQNQIVSNYVLPLKNSTTPNSVRNILILEGLIINLRSNIEIDCKFKIIRNLLSKETFELESEKFEIVCQIFGNLLNKSRENECFENILSEIDSKIDENLGNVENKCEDLITVAQKNALNLFGWVTKSLLMKGSPHSERFLEKSMILLEKYVDYANCFGLIMDDKIECLGRESYCQIRLFYRQQFLGYVIKKFDESIKNLLPNYLLALGSILPKTSIQIIKVHLKEVLRLLVLCLRNCDQSVTLISVLDTLQILISEKCGELEPHFDNLIEDFLRLSTFKCSMKVRLGALICLEALVKNYAVITLTPYQKNVIYGLVPCIDDIKRMVRKQAVVTRTAWILLGNS